MLSLRCLSKAVLLLLAAILAILLLLVAGLAEAGLGKEKKKKQSEFERMECLLGASGSSCANTEHEGRGQKARTEAPFLHGGRAQKARTEAPFLHGGRAQKARTETPFLPGGRAQKARTEAPFSHGECAQKARTEAGFLHEGCVQKIGPGTPRTWNWTEKFGQSRGAFLAPLFVHQQKKHELRHNFRTEGAASFDNFLVASSRTG